MECVVFDFDGPLFDGRKAAETAMENTIESFAATFPRPKLQVSTLALFDPKRLVSLLYRELESKDQETICGAYRQQLYQMERQIGVAPPVRAALTSLAASGVALSIYSARNLDNLQPLLQDLGLTKYFPNLGCSPEYMKPSGDYFRNLAGKLNLKVSDLLYVGDSDWDYAAAKDADVPYYHACWTGEPTAIANRKADLQLASLADLVTLLTTDISNLSDTADSTRELFEALGRGHVAFYAGAGISVPSGIGGWEQHYRPVLDRLCAGFLASDSDLPEVVQLLAANPVRAKRVFDAFSDSFSLKDAVPATYHFAMLRSNAEHIWTSNYDDLFEKAIVTGHFGECRIVHNDDDLLEGFRAGHLIVKMNGDFSNARFDADKLDWGVVFLQEQFDRAERDRPEIWRLFEDDYRQRSILFVGVSFRDPVLRRIVTVARQRIPRTRYNHYLIAKREQDRAARMKQSMFAENLRRASIITIFKESHEEIADFVQRIALAAYRPVVGFSGDVGRISNEDAAGQTTPPGITPPLTAGDIGRICGDLGAELARKGIRITSGCAPFVGKPAVEAAFAENPGLARFYLRKHGGTTYKSTAPAIVVEGDDYASMRNRFIPELSTLIAVGGGTDAAGKSGTLEEIDLAMGRGIPVVLLSPVGGAVGAQYKQLRARIDRVYKDDRLARDVGDLNDAVASKSPAELRDFAREKLPDAIEKLLSGLMGAGAALRQERPGRDW